MTSRLVRVDPYTNSLSDPHIVAINAAIEAFQSLLPTGGQLRSLSFFPDANVANLFYFEFTTKDNRTWNETWLFSGSSDANPAISFNVPVGFLLNDITSHRVVRDAIITARNATGLNVFDIEWVDSSTPAAQIVELMVSPGTVVHGQPVTVSWIAPGAGNIDWVGLFHAGDDPHNYLAYVFVASQSPGSHAFTAPATPGLYEFRYLLNNGYISVATSVTFTVT